MNQLKPDLKNNEVEDNNHNQVLLSKNKDHKMNFISSKGLKEKLHAAKFKDSPHLPNQED